jgi:hypothetical protein
MQAIYMAAIYEQKKNGVESGRNKGKKLFDLV